jgi:thioester reductase-like protein
VGRLWQAGVDVDWAALHGPARPRRTPLPAYPFQRRRHWIPAGDRPPVAAADDDGREARSSDGNAPSLAADAPRGDRERRLAALWRDLLGVPHVGRNDDFGALGGHSFLAMQLGRRIRTDLGATVTVRDLFAHPTVAELADLLAEREHGGTANRPDLIAEARLDPAITADGVPPAAGPVTDVFLTGATGFLGAHLCAELLRRTTATVRCLVRADDPRGAAERLRTALDRAGLGDAADAAGERLVAVPGDLSRERLGLTGADFADLAERTGLIVHCGAWVNFVRPYRALRDTNVLGTQEVLRLAATGRRTPVHHVSTLAVLAGALAGGAPATIGEDGPLPPPVGHDTAYSESKWVGEQLVWEAGRRGVPVAVHRPGVVLGATTTGVSNPDDYYTRLVQGCVRLGLAPARSFPQHGGPVDVVAQQIVTIALRPDSPGRAFHNIAEQPLAWDRIFELVHDAGYRVDRVPFTRWRAALDERLETDPDPALATLGSLLTAAPDREMPAFATANAREFGGAALPARRLDDPRYFDTLLGFFARHGWIPQRPVPDQEAS